VVTIALGVVSYLACRRLHQSIPQGGNAPGGEEHGAANGFTVIFDNSQTINGSPPIDQANGSEGNPVANGNIYH